MQQLGALHNQFMNFHGNMFLNRVCHHCGFHKLKKTKLRFWHDLNTEWPICPCHLEDEINQEVNQEDNQEDNQEENNNNQDAWNNGGGNNNQANLSQEEILQIRNLLVQFPQLQEQVNNLSGQMNNLSGQMNEQYNNLSLQVNQMNQLLQALLANANNN